jgi:hypothetical protein
MTTYTATELMQNITITWVSMRDSEQTASMNFWATTFYNSDIELLEKLYENTNLYQGHFWDRYIANALPANRTHTALSVNDLITLDDGNGNVRTYKCADFGWERVEA